MMISFKYLNSATIITPVMVVRFFVSDAQVVVELQGDAIVLLSGVATVLRCTSCRSTVSAGALILAISVVSFVSPVSCCST